MINQNDRERHEIIRGMFDLRDAFYIAANAEVGAGLRKLEPNNPAIGSLGHTTLRFVAP